MSAEATTERGDRAERIDWRRYDAVVADLDGVLTDTATIHARAWNRAFDELRERCGGGFDPFSIEDDYARLVDGKPRLDGVRAFLADRGVELEEGGHGDGLDDETVHGVGARKNEVYHEMLEREGVPVFKDAVRRVRALKRAGTRLAVVSSSRNCRRVLRAAGLEALFEQRVDGETLDEKGLRGKPAPDLFEEALCRLGVPGDRAAAVEDAVSGVEAARAAGFALVVGVDRSGDGRRLRGAGADVVVAGLGADRPPSALERFEEAFGAAAGREVALCLDYDGTLTPIVDRPEDADLPAPTRAAVERLAPLCLVAVISGRDLEDVRARVGIDGIWYAGSHGLDLRSPSGESSVPEVARGFEGALDEAQGRLEDRLRGVEGAQVERKRFAIAVHYRRVEASGQEGVVRAAREVGESFDRLRVSEGKKIVEVRPRADWDKGRAVEWILERTGAERRRALPIYLGDDTTDGDAFRSVGAMGGLGVVVGDEPPGAVADYALADPEETRALLERLARALEGGDGW